MCWERRQRHEYLEVIKAQVDKIWTAYWEVTRRNAATLEDFAAAEKKVAQMEEALADKALADNAEDSDAEPESGLTVPDPDADDASQDNPEADYSGGGEHAGDPPGSFDVGPIPGHVPNAQQVEALHSLFRLYVGRSLAFRKQVDATVDGYYHKTAERRHTIRVKTLLKIAIGLGWLPRRIRKSSRHEYAAQQAKEANRREKKAARQGQVNRRLMTQH